MDLVRQAKELSELHPAAKWAPPVSSAGVCRSSAAAVELEVLRASALERLRKKLSKSCSEAGLAKAPLLALERWRFTSKWLEEERARTDVACGTPRKGKALVSLDPVLPHRSGSLSNRKHSTQSDSDQQSEEAQGISLASEGLIQDLMLSGMSKVCCSPRL